MKKGVSLAALTATITIMIILITTVTISGSKMSNNSKRSNFATEISTIQKAVDSYLQKNENDYPILNTVVINLANVSDENKAQFTNNGDTITNDTISLFEIDYSKIGYTDLQYGNKKDGENDIYVLSAVTGKVYYAKGFKIGSKVYYTLTQELEKVLEYKTTDSIISGDNDIILYSQENLENSEKKVSVKIPTDYSVTSVKVGDTSYSATSTEGYNLYEITGIPGNVIDIIYTYNGETKTTSYKIKASNEKTEEGYAKDGLILHYDGINNTGNGHSSTTTVWKDLSGNGNDGFLTNFDNTTTSGWSQNYLLFDALNDYVKIDELNYEKVTVEIVLKFNSLTSNEQCIVSNYQAGGYGISYSGAFKNRKNNFQMYENSTGYVVASATNVAQTNKIYSLSGLYDNKTMILRENDEINKVDMIGEIRKPSSGTYMVIGGNPYLDSVDLTQTLFSGCIYSVRIYNRALTENEIKQNYEVDKERFGI